MITNAALKNGFTGGLIVDFPNSKKAKKFFLFLMAGYSDEIAKDAERAIMMPKARTDGEDYSDVDMSDDEENS
jgi:18S rRNA (guanine1575-N7)-methyltransferase